MKQTVNINLGGHPLIIDEDACSILQTYLSSIENQFADSPGKDEIMHDIEARIAELFGEEMKGREIVSRPDVEKVIQIMGTPDDFETDEFMEGEHSFTEANQNENASSEYRVGKRLFRDPNDKVVGGVASGLSAYFGIQDPVWLRIGFALLFFFSGTGLIAYLLLWIIVPEAKTASDRLAMNGEPINVNNIAKSVEEELEEIGKNLGKLGDQLHKKHWKKKNKDKKKAEHKSPTD